MPLVSFTLDQKTRWRNHKNHSTCLRLRHAICKYGIKEFDFSELHKLLSGQDRTEVRKCLTKIEQNYLDKVFYVNGKKNPLLYNANPIANHGNFTKDRSKSIQACLDRLEEFEIESPDGKIYRSKNVKQFAIQHNLDPGNTTAVLNGKRKHHKGWRKPGTTCEIGNPYKLRSPAGEIIEGHNMSQLCRDQQLSPTRMSMVLHGKQANHKGWTTI